jgi:AraC-like DNA-binding protein
VTGGKSLGREAYAASAALTAGFFDQSALNKQFKRSLGITPLQYTRAL